jgi:hypothetical protein
MSTPFNVPSSGGDSNASTSTQSNSNRLSAERGKEMKWSPVVPEHLCIFWSPLSVWLPSAPRNAARQLRVCHAPRAPDQDRRARHRAHRAHPRPTADELPGGSVVQSRRARPAAIRPLSRGAACADEPPTEADQPQTRCTASRLTPIQPVGSPTRARSPDVQKRATSCMIKVMD